MFALCLSVHGRMVKVFISGTLKGDTTRDTWLMCCVGDNANGHSHATMEQSCLTFLLLGHKIR